MAQRIGYKKEMNRREFLAGAAACAGTFCAAGCTLINPVPTIDADAEGGFELPPDLLKPGGQVKVRLAGVDEPILVWRTEQGERAATVTCPHYGSEVHYNAAEGTLDCPSHGSRFAQDGKVLHGPAKRPLQPFTVTAQGNRRLLTPA